MCFFVLWEGFYGDVCGPNAGHHSGRIPHTTVPGTGYEFSSTFKIILITRGGSKHSPLTRTPTAASRLAGPAKPTFHYARLLRVIDSTPRKNYRGETLNLSVHKSERAREAGH